MRFANRLLDLCESTQHVCEQRVGKTTRALAKLPTFFLPVDALNSNILARTAGFQNYLIDFTKLFYHLVAIKRLIDATKKWPWSPLGFVTYFGERDGSRATVEFV